MKKIISFCVILFFSGHIIAQQQFNSEKALQMAKLEKAIQQKKTGTALTAIGAVLFGVGIIVGSNSSQTTTSTYGSPSQTTSTGNPGLAQTSFLLGIAGLGVGIPMWSVGAHREKKANNLQGVSLSVIPHANGVTLRCRF
jgi:hypothetical protein